MARRRQNDYESVLLRSPECEHQLVQHSSLPEAFVPCSWRGKCGALNPDTPCQVCRVC
jgi:hypothetical protein